MIRSCFRISVRSLFRQKGYTAINVLGLAIGIASCLYIMAYVRAEISVDRHHEKADRIYRVIREERTSGQPASFSPGTSGSLAPALIDDIPEIEGAVRLWMRPDVWARSGDDGAYLMSGMVDAEILQMFDFLFPHGDPESALRNPYTLVLTSSTARRFFGERDPRGETVTLEHWYFQSREYEVTGVIEDPAKNSSLWGFDFLTSTILPGEPLNWWTSWHGHYSLRPISTFVLLRDGVDPDRVRARLPDLMERYMGEEIRGSNTYHLQPLERVHLYSRQDFGVWSTNDIDRVRLYVAIAVLIVAIACINFINLATARSTLRAREVGLRKVVGAGRSQLVVRFLSESMLIVIVAAAVSLALTACAMPFLNPLTGISVTLSSALDPPILLGLTGLILLIGLLAGSYPAFVVAALQPVSALRGRHSSGGSGRRLREGLVLLQFVASIVLMIGTTVMHRQVDHLLGFDSGFERNDRVMIPIFAKHRVLRKRDEANPALAGRYLEVKQAFLEHLKVTAATVLRAPLGEGLEIIREVRVESERFDQWRVGMGEVDEDFVPFYGLEILVGRNFSADIPTDRYGSFLMNETAAKHLGWRPEEAIGKSIVWGRNKGHVIGVLKDFHNVSFRDDIRPLVISMRPNIYQYLGLRIARGDLLEILKETWNRFLPGRPFEYVFEDDRLNRMYEEDRRMANLGSLFSGLAILVGCLGLLGLAAFSANQRTREVGIRKVLGSTTSSVVLLLSRDFVRLVILANLIAWPTGYVVMQSWLENFVYRIGVEWWVFPVSGSCAAAIAFLTVGFQGWQAAVADPVES